MRYLSVILILFSSLALKSQFSSSDTMIWKYDAGFRTNLIRFDSNLVEGIVESAQICGCDTIIDFLHRSDGEINKYDGFYNGFSEEIRNYAFKLSLTNSKCSTEVLDNYSIKDKFHLGGISDLLRLSQYTFLEEIFSHKKIYFPILVKLLTETNYKFKHRNSSDIFLRKNIALLLHEVALSISLLQLESLDKDRLDYVNSLVLSKAEIKSVKDPSSKFPEKL